jgi:hypothetical protein
MIIRVKRKGTNSGNFARYRARSKTDVERVAGLLHEHYIEGVAVAEADQISNDQHHREGAGEIRLLREPEIRRLRVQIAAGKKGIFLEFCRCSIFE